MQCIQFCDFTTDEALARKMFKDLEDQLGFKGGRVYPVGNGYRVQVFFELASWEHPQEYPLPHGCRLVHVPKVLNRVLGIQ